MKSNLRTAFAILAYLALTPLSEEAAFVSTSIQPTAPKKVANLVDNIKNLVGIAKREDLATYLEDETTKMIEEGAQSHEREADAKHLRQELHPYCLGSYLGERSITKPLGYPGDYLTIDHIYNNVSKGKNLLGKQLDSIILQTKAARAVRNRRKLLSREIESTVLESASMDRAAQVTSLACGPAREIQDFLLANARSSQPVGTFSFHLIDMDMRALNHVHSWIQESSDEILGKRSSIHLHQANVLHLCTSKTKLDFPLQDLIYSVGLIDYFSDRVVVRILDWAHGMLRPGGKVILGNFHPRNPTRAFMDKVIDWPLTYRTEEDMKALFRQSKFGRNCKIIFEAEQVNLFAMCEK